MGFTHGYCSHCLTTVVLARLEEHQAVEHAGTWIYLTFYRPDPIHMAQNIATADELTRAAAEVEDPPSSDPTSAAQS